MIGCVTYSLLVVVTNHNIGIIRKVVTKCTIVDFKKQDVINVNLVLQAFTLE